MRPAGLAALIVSSLALPVLATPPPRVVIDAARRLVIASLPPVLAEEAVSRQLDSGLTTSFVFRAQLGGRDVGAARVDVRYDLWDEVFEVVAVGSDGRGERRALAGREALEAWWSGLELALVETAALPSPGRDELHLLLEVIPFSASEQDDAQRWFARSFGSPSGGEGATGADAGERRGDSLEKVLGVLMATSIRGSVLFTMRWSVTVPGGG